MNPAAPVTMYRTTGAYRGLPLEPVETRIADEVEPVLVGHDRRVLAVRVGPERVPGERVQRVRPALQGGEVDAAGDDRRRPGDRPVRHELPLDVARRGVEAEELAVVRADVDALSPHGGRRVDVTAGRLRPAELPARRAERVDLAVRRADVDAAVRHGRRRV